MKSVLIVWHSQFGGTLQMAVAARDGARAMSDVDVSFLHARDADAEDLLRCDALLLATSENFGSLSGMTKDFLERVYYPCDQRVAGKPYALLVCAGTDGTGARMQAERIAKGLGLRKVHPGLIHCSRLTAQVQRIPPDVLAACREIGALLAAGVSGGMF